MKAPNDGFMNVYKKGRICRSLFRGNQYIYNYWINETKCHISARNLNDRCSQWHQYMDRHRDLMIHLIALSKKIWRYNHSPPQLCVAWRELALELMATGYPLVFLAFLVWTCKTKQYVSYFKNCRWIDNQKEKEQTWVTWHA